MKAHTLWTLWTRVVKKCAGAVALTDAASGREWSFSEMHAEAIAASRALKRVRPGEAVAFVCPNGVEWWSRFLATQALGAAALPLDATLPESAWRDTAARAGAWWLWTDDGLTRVGKHRRRAPGVCCIKTTSGTTGEMKTVRCRPSHLIADGIQIIRTMKIRPRDRNLALIPFGHSYGLGNLVMPLILQGTPLVTASSFVPHQIAEWITRFRVTVFPSVPAVFRVLAEIPSIKELSPLRLAISAGAPLSPEIARAVHAKFGIRIHNFYGSSETGGICYDRTGFAVLKGGGVGRPMEGVRVRCSRGGRIEVRSQAVVPGSTGSRMGRYVLPDLGQWNARRELRLIGRRGTVANIGGRKVHPSEIEVALRSIAGVSDAWATVMGPSGGRDHLVAVVETVRPSADVERELAELLPVWKLPRRCVTTPCLPRTERGKTDRIRLQALLL